MGCNTSNGDLSGHLPYSLSVPPSSIVEQKNSECRQSFILDQNIFAREARQEKASSYVIMWLDANVNKTEENLKFQSMLRQLSDQVKAYDNVEECETEIRQQGANAQENIYLIISCSFGQVFVPKINDIAQIVGIFVFCSNITINEEWIRNCPKVKAVDNQLHLLRTSIENELITLSNFTDVLPMEINSDASQEQTHSVGSIELTQIHTALQIFMRVEDSSSREDMLRTLREHYDDNPQQLAFIEEFDREYIPEKAVWWYTRETCFYRFLNKELRLQNVDLVLSCRYFVVDLYKQLKAEHEKFLKLREGNNPVFHVYRGQVISKKELNKLEQNIDRYLTMNSFVSTSPRRETAEIFLNSTTIASYNLVSVVFEIEIDIRRKNTKPYADITHLSYFPNEQEVLIMLGAVFKIDEVSQSRGGVATVKLSLHNGDKNELKDMSEQAVAYIDESDIILQGIIIDNKEELQQYFKNLLSNLSSDNPDVSACYFQLTKLAQPQDNNNEAITLLDEAVAACLRITPNKFSRLSRYYLELAQTYFDAGNYQMCIRTGKGLHNIQMKYLPELHYSVAENYNLIGSAYHLSRDYDNALIYFQRGLNIRLKTLSQNHQDIAVSYNNIGAVYVSKQDFVSAIEFYKKSIEIYRNCIPPNLDRLHVTEGFLQDAYDKQLA